AEPPAAFCRRQRDPRFYAADVPRRSQGLRRRHRPRVAVHAGRARAGGGSLTTDPGRARTAAILGAAGGIVAAGAMTLTVHATVRAASERLAAPAAEKTRVAVAGN